MNVHRCDACGHLHRTMASITLGRDIRWYCHEDDHSCYVAAQPELVRRLRKSKYGEGSE